MDEEIRLINANARSEKIKNFFSTNKKKIIISLSILIFLLIFFFLFLEFKEKSKIKLAERYNQITKEYIVNKNDSIKDQLIGIIYENDSTYSPLALYFLIDNNILIQNEKLNELFDQVINKNSFDKEIKDLIIYKKALFNSEFSSENEILNILNPIIKSESIWRSHALYLLAEYFYSKNEKEKSKEFFNQIISLKNSNPNIRLEAEKRLNRDFSD
jgi:predicted negative regulator of RcsB-dependent stress response|tara:strand:+ start:3039 stop:3683 length:645 start_codon:yes stop_codon:yes gene_type:complete